MCSSDLDDFRLALLANALIDDVHVRCLHRGRAVPPRALRIVEVIDLFDSAIGSVDEHSSVHVVNAAERRSEERRVGKECRSRWSPYH